MKLYWPPPSLFHLLDYLDFSVISKKAMASTLKSFSALGEDLSLLGFKRYLKMEFQVLAYIMAKELLFKAGIFEMMTKEKVHLMIGIVSGTKINWAYVIFKIMAEMLQKESTDFEFQISKLLQDASFSFTATSDGTSITMIDAEIVVDLRPKPFFVLEFMAIKKQIYEEKHMLKIRRTLNAR